jgi:hypothetical protein
VFSDTDRPTCLPRFGAPVRGHKVVPCAGVVLLANYESVLLYYGEAAPLPTRATHGSPEAGAYRSCHALACPPGSQSCGAPDYGLLDPVRCGLATTPSPNSPEPEELLSVFCAFRRKRKISPLLGSLFSFTPIHLYLAPTRPFPILGREGLLVNGIARWGALQWLESNCEERASPGFRGPSAPPIQHKRGNGSGTGCSVASLFNWISANNRKATTGISDTSVWERQAEECLNKPHKPRNLFTCLQQKASILIRSTEKRSEESTVLLQV